MDDLHRQIIELQGKLLEKQTPGKQSDNLLPARYTFRDIRYTSASMKRVVEQCEQIAKNDSSVMIYGETGTGKELFAQSIHNASSRKDRPFLAINCAAIPENLLEGLLFGTERGAYTGAERRAELFAGWAVLRRSTRMSAFCQTSISHLIRLLKKENCEETCSTGWEWSISAFRLCGNAGRTLACWPKPLSSSTTKALLKM